MLQHAFDRFGIPIQLSTTEYQLSDEDFCQKSIGNFLKDFSLSEDVIETSLIRLQFCQQSNCAAGFLKLEKSFCLQLAIESRSGSSSHDVLVVVHQLLEALALLDNLLEDLCRLSILRWHRNFVLSTLLIVLLLALICIFLDLSHPA